MQNTLIHPNSYKILTIPESILNLKYKVSLKNELKCKWMKLKYVSFWGKLLSSSCKPVKSNLLYTPKIQWWERFGTDTCAPCKREKLKSVTGPEQVQNELVPLHDLIFSKDPTSNNFTLGIIISTYEFWGDKNIQSIAIVIRKIAGVQTVYLWFTYSQEDHWCNSNKKNMMDLRYKRENIWDINIE